jgi:hypothetical protein
MSSSEGLEILKNWHSTDTTVLVASRGWKKGTALFETPAKIVSVDSSALVVSVRATHLFTRRRW